MRESFVFYRSFYEAISELPDKQQLTLYKAICNYALDGEEIALNGMAKLIYGLVKPQLMAKLIKNITE